VAYLTKAITELRFGAELSMAAACSEFAPSSTHAVIRGMSPTPGRLCSSVRNCHCAGGYRGVDHCHRLVFFLLEVSVQNGGQWLVRRQVMGITGPYRQWVARLPGAA